MALNSRIEWTGHTWNPVTGCDKFSAGCEHCYAERMARRLKAMGVDKYRDGFKVRLHRETLEEPLKWKKPQMIFVNSMSDLFHDEVPLEFIQDIFDVMKRCDHHIFQVLTKRSKRLKRLHKKLCWPKNVWMGVSVESKEYNFRSNDLCQTGAQTKFLSLEPLIGPVTGLDLGGIDWAVVGGESGPGARPIEQDWVLEIKEMCRTHKTAFFFKQWGGPNKKKTGRKLLRKHWDEMPPSYEDHARIYPIA